MGLNWRGYKAAFFVRPGIRQTAFIVVCFRGGGGGGGGLKMRNMRPLQIVLM